MISAAWANALGWALLHSLWEGAAIALVLAVLLHVLQSAQARYTAACLALLAMVTVFSVTVVQERPQQTAASSIRIYPSAIQNEPSPSFPKPFPQSDLPQYLALLWMTGVLLFHLRTLVSWLAAQRLRRRGVCLAPEAWQQQFVELRRKMRLPQSVALFESYFARVPVVIGFLRPVVLVPLGMLSSMPAGQVETILLHELAHIRRHDSLVNLLQAVAENFLFFHPAMWWISAVIRREREHCCDDLVVGVCGSAGEYAQALTTLETNRWTASNAVLAANSGGNLMRRITRILYPQEVKQPSLAPIFLAGVLTLFAAVALNAWQAQPGEPEKDVYQKWLNEDVVYLIHPLERAAFLQLTTDPERERFVEQFWERRDPTPGTALNEFKVEYYRRIGYANDHFSSVSGTAGWKTDRGRIYILFGPPNEIESHPDASSAIGAPYENWLFYKINGIGEQVMVQFIDKNGKGEFQMTKDPHATK